MTVLIVLVVWYVCFRISRALLVNSWLREFDLDQGDLNLLTFLSAFGPISVIWGLIVWFTEMPTDSNKNPIIAKKGERWRL